MTARTFGSDESGFFNRFWLFAAIFLFTPIILWSVIVILFSPLIGLITASAASKYTLNMAINAICSYVLPSAIVYGIYKGNIKSAKKPNYGFKPWHTVLFLFAMLFCGSMASLAVKFISEAMNSVFGTGLIEDALQAVEPASAYETAVFAVFVAVLAPIGEEILFRRLLLRAIQPYGDRLAVIITAALFAIYHGNLDQAPYAFVVGLFLGIAAVRSGSTIVPIILHLLNNTLITLGQYGETLFGKNFFGSISTYLLNDFTILILGLCALILLIIIGGLKLEKAESKGAYSAVIKNIFFPLFLVAAVISFVL